MAACRKFGGKGREFQLRCRRIGIGGDAVLIRRCCGTHHATLPTIVAISSTPATAASSASSAALFTRRIIVARCRRASSAVTRTGTHGARRSDFELSVLKLGDAHQPLLRRVRYELGELRVAVVLLVEAGVDVLHDLLEPIGAHHVAVLLHPTDGFDDQLPGVPLLHIFFALLDQAGERIVAVVLIAVHDQQVARRLADADADDVLAVLLELGDHRREVGVAREQDVGANLGSGKDQFDGVDGEADVGGVLLGRPVGGRHDHVDRRLGQWHDVLRVAAPVGVGALDGDLSFDDVGAEERP